jgi:hypothetical protein
MGEKVFSQLMTQEQKFIKVGHLTMTDFFDRGWKLDFLDEGTAKGIMRR